MDSHLDLTKKKNIIYVVMMMILNLNLIKIMVQKQNMQERWLLKVC